MRRSQLGGGSRVLNGLSTSRCRIPDKEECILEFTVFCFRFLLNLFDDEEQLIQFFVCFVHFGTIGVSTLPSVSFAGEFDVVLEFTGVFFHFIKIERFCAFPL